jgi:L-ascorbate metabolism protein UlaG (beta-lactamase superfamily)
MIITYFGKQFFKIQQGEMTLAFNPVSKNSKTGISTRFGADLALISTNHPDYNGEEQLFHGDRAPFIISGPGDYEVKDIFIKGLLSNAEIENKKYINTIYSLTVDGINLVFLGALSDINLSKEVKEVISEPDIIFVPADGNGLIDAKSSAKLVFSLEPKMIIPMDYTSASLKSFLKEMEAEEIAPVEKLTLKKKDLENKKNEVVVLKSN